MTLVVFFPSHQGAEGRAFPPELTPCIKSDGEVDGLELPWSVDRKEKIASGNSDPTELELRRWALPEAIAFTIGRTIGQVLRPVCGVLIDGRVQ